MIYTNTPKSKASSIYMLQMQRHNSRHSFKFNNTDPDRITCDVISIAYTDQQPPTFISSMYNIDCSLSVFRYLSWCAKELTHSLLHSWKKTKTFTLQVQEMKDIYTCTSLLGKPKRFNDTTITSYTASSMSVRS